ncbi:MAG: hypothetical protein N2Z80_00365 [Hydrogenothermaceae bacterium]|nr:hypothetical protein [Hydrogenothermaceae bacterium]
MNVDDLLKKMDDAIVLLTIPEYIEASLEELGCIYHSLEEIAYEDISTEKKLKLMERIQALNSILDNLKENLIKKLHDKEKEKSDTGIWT